MTKTTDSAEPQLNGKTILYIEGVSQRHDWHDSYVIHFTDGTKCTLDSDGGPYCSSSLRFGDIKSEEA